MKYTRVCQLSLPYILVGNFLNVFFSVGAWRFHVSHLRPLLDSYPIDIMSQEKVF